MESFNQLFGLPGQELHLYQMLLRALVVYFVALAFIRVAGLRTLGTQNAFDKLTLLMMGAILGRSIVASDQPFVESLVVVLLVMILRRLLALMTYKSRTMGMLFKGSSIVLWEDNKFDESNMRQTLITEEDVNTALHYANVNNFKQVEKIFMERSGEISVIKKQG
jgi:uncharacterized membrane protein YcaP (DUF421 family)